MSNAASWPDELLAAIQMAKASDEDKPAVITVPRPNMAELARMALARMCPGRDIEVRTDTDQPWVSVTMAPPANLVTGARESILGAMVDRSVKP